MVITSFTFTINTCWNLTSIKIEDFIIYKYIYGTKQYSKCGNIYIIKKYFSVKNDSIFEFEINEETFMAFKKNQNVCHVSILNANELDLLLHD